jgi:hypothetical protein
MREIKFRQPLFLKGKFSRFHYWGFINDGNFSGPAGELAQAREQSQQFICRHGKNGQEIFEGDVVAIMGSDCSKCPAKDENGDCALTDESCPVVEKHRDVVTMERFPLYWLKNEFFGYEGEDLVSPDECEVIGNVYEHPELLAATQASQDLETPLELENV